MNTWPQPLALPLSPRLRAAAYWAATACVAAELGVGGVWDIARLPFVRDVVAHLGYPSYFLTILGTWKILGAIVVLSPRLPRLKEWAYAGMIFDLTGAAASRASLGDPIAMVVVPLVISGVVIASWALRPEGRRLESPRD